MSHLQIIQKKISEACKRVNRDPQEVTLIGASKYQPIEKIVTLARAGLRDFAENYWQELKKRRETIAAKAPDIAAHLRWHFIGSLQRRKVRYLVGQGILIHSLDNETLASEIERRGAKTDALIQINTGHEESKGGVSPERLESLLQACFDCQHLKIRGLMCLPPFDEDPEEVRPHFRTLRKLRDEMNHRDVYKNPLTELSMGMSHDFEVAIEEGTTMVRIGTALFGPRR